MVIFDKCPHCNLPAIEIEQAEDKFQVYAFCSECDEILDITNYLPQSALHGYLQLGFRVFIPKPTE